MLRLVIEDDEGRKTVVPFVRDEITIGRQEGNTIRLTERNVSRRHCRLLKQNGHLLVEDLNSSYGIKINGSRIAGVVALAEGDLIEIGDYDLRINHDSPSTNATTSPVAPAAPAWSTEDTKPRGTDPKDVKAALGGSAETAPALEKITSPVATVDDIPEADPDDVKSAAAIEARRAATSVIRVEQVEAAKPRQVVAIDPADAPKLVVVNTEFAGKEFVCTKNELKIGRTEENDISLDHRSLSRTHCKIVREDTGEWRVIDMQSANGLSVNGEPYSEATLHPGDVLELGHLKLKFVGAGAPSTIIVDEAQTREPRPRAPIFIAVFALAVLLAYVGFKALRSPTPPPEPVAVTPIPSTGPSEAERAAAAGRVAKAKDFISSLDWESAITELKGCTPADACRAAEELLNQMQGSEKAYKNALEQVDTIIEQGKFDAAQQLLDGSKETVLLSELHQAMGEKLRRAREEAQKKAPGTKPKEPPPPVGVKPKEPPVAVKPPTDTQPPPKMVAEVKAIELETEGRLLIKQKQYDAAVVKMLSCIKQFPDHPECEMVLGVAHYRARRFTPAIEHLNRFLEIAPTHASAPQVKTLLEAVKKDAAQ